MMNDERMTDVYGDGEVVVPRNEELSEDSLHELSR